MKEFYDAYFYYIIAADILIGLLFGLIPLIFGIKRGKRNFGLLGFILAGGVSVLSPLLSILIAGIFTFLVLRKVSDPSADTTNAVGPVDPSL